ncbi:hypothetical protein FB45DRAFT_425516 [Roridomyces roridus]|uniref:Uncharacterized protein n=1 Tax=Roridomyces roridus TaxID=1738132 RepID=A0AAD7C5U4_9AGAR|nr:hypothetical protein FB45DRAFT_425516 [Roridomyces roridus]
MIISGGAGPAGDGKADTEPPRSPSPPPAYSTSASSNALNPGTLAVQQEPELPSAFRPPTPSSFPHPHPSMHSTGPTPFFSPQNQNNSYAYHDPRSPYSLALADRRAFVRFWAAFTWAVGVLLVLWLLDLVRVG